MPEPPFVHGETGEGAGLSDEEFSALMQKVSAFAPLARGLLGTAPGAPDQTRPPAAGGAGARREALLAAMKPYLSPQRRAAADYLIRMWRAVDAIRALR